MFLLLENSKVTLFLKNINYYNTFDVPLFLLYLIAKINYKTFLALLLEYISIISKYIRFNLYFLHLLALSMIFHRLYKLYIFFLIYFNIFLYILIYFFYVIFIYEIFVNFKNISLRSIEGLKVKGIGIMPVSKKRKKIAKGKPVKKERMNLTEVISNYSKAIDYGLEYAILEIDYKKDENLAKIKEWGTISIPSQQLAGAFHSMVKAEDIYKKIVTIIALHIVYDLEDGMIAEDNLVAKHLPLYTSLIHTFYDVENIKGISNRNFTVDRIFKVEFKRDIIF